AGRPVGAFVARLCGIEREWRAQAAAAGPEAVLFRFRRDFLQRRAVKAKLPQDLGGEEANRIELTGRAMEQALFPNLPWPADPELATSRMASELLDLESDFLAAVRQKKIPAVPDASSERGRELARLASSAAGADTIPRPAGASDEMLLAFLEALIAAYAAWSGLRLKRSDLRREIRSWTSFHLPEPVDYAALVETERPNRSIPEERVGPRSRRRRRDGFGL